MFGVSCNTIGRWMESGKMQYHTNEKKQRYCTEEDLHQFLSPEGKLNYEQKDKYTRKEMMKFLNCSEKTIQRLDVKGILHPQKGTDGRYYYTVKDIRDYEIFLTKKLAPDVPQIYTRKEIAKMINCSERTIIRLEQRGVLKPKKTPTGRYQYTIQDIKDYMLYLSQNKKHSQKLLQIKKYFSDKKISNEYVDNADSIKKEIYSVRELTSIYRISDKTVFEWAKQGILIREKDGYKLNGDVKNERTDEKNNRI